MMDQDYRSQVWDDSVIQWLAVEIVSGQVIGELPDLQASTLSVRMEDITSTEAQLPYDKAPDNWLELTTPYKIALILVRDHIPQWGGIIIKRERELANNGITLTLSTIEHYLDSVYVKTVSYRHTQQTKIAGNLVNLTEAHRFYVQPDVGESIYLRDRDYDETQNKTVLSALQELSNVINGPEWYGTWRETDAGHYQPSIVIRDTIGQYRQQAVFEESAMAKLTVLEDYSTGYGANMVQATSSADGGENPLSNWQVYNDFARPVIEYKYQAGTSITRLDTLNQHALNELNSIKNGTTTISFTTSLENSPQPGIDWNLGDIVKYQLSSVSQYLPDFDSGKVRIIGYDLDYSQAWQLTPLLRPVEEE